MQNLKATNKLWVPGELTLDVAAPGELTLNAVAPEELTLDVTTPGELTLDVAASTFRRLSERASLPPLYGGRDWFRVQIMKPER